MKKLVNGELVEMTPEEIAEWEAGQTPSLPPAPTQAVVSAMADLNINGDEITGIETAVGIGAAMAIDTGLYWLFFPQSQPDTSYIPFVQAPGFTVDWTDRQLEYFEIVVTDRETRQPATPARLLISIQRVQ